MYTAVYMLAADAAVAAAVFGLEHLISYCNRTKRCFGPTSRGQGRRMCHAMPNHKPGEVNPKQQLPFCCRSPCESRHCCAAVAVPSGSELPSSLMLRIYSTYYEPEQKHSSNSNRSQRRRDDVRGTPTPLADDRARTATILTHRGTDCRVCIDYTSIYYCCKSFPRLLHDVMVGE